MSSSARRRSIAVLFGIGLIALLVGACGGGEKKSSSGSTPAASGDVSGTYEVVQDSDGTKPRTGATVTLVLDKGTLSVRAVSGDEELTDTGTYSTHDGLMTIEFIEQQITATDQPYKVSGDTLEIPVKMFGEGAGSSTWKRTDGLAASEPTSEPEAAELKSDWSDWDLKKDVGAATTKRFVEMVNDDGKEWEQAVTDAAAYARTLPDVAEVEVSANGLNIAILYKDGDDEFVITERMDLETAATSSIADLGDELLVSAEPGAARADETSAAFAEECSALPGSPAAAPRAPEPGRDGLNPAGGFGVSLYEPGTNPKPITSVDTPPKRALLLAPAYDLAHPLRNHKKVELMPSFRGTVGDHIECIYADLKDAGYEIDPILGKEEGGKPAHTGDQAIDELAKLLTTQSYGVFYALSHGGNQSPRWYPYTESWIYMGLLDLERPELKKAVAGRKMTKEVQNDIVAALIAMTGLTWDGSGSTPFKVGAEFNGSAVIWMTPAFFELMRAQKSVSFSKTLVFLNLCSSATDSSLKDAFAAKTFFGWSVPVNGEFAGTSSETIFDAAKDPARSARDAWWNWRRHEAWKIEKNAETREDGAKPEQIKAYGVGGEEYTPITSQSVILIYRLRNGPSSASSDIAKSLLVVKSCSELFWSQGKKTGLASPACHNLEFGNQLPTVEEVNDAVFEVGGPATQPFGRWTMAD